MTVLQHSDIKMQSLMDKGIVRQKISGSMVGYQELRFNII